MILLLGECFSLSLSLSLSSRNSCNSIFIYENLLSWILSYLFSSFLFLWMTMMMMIMMMMMILALPSKPFFPSLGKYFGLIEEVVGMLNDTV
jgi:hypothetical protein